MSKDSEQAGSTSSRHFLKLMGFVKEKPSLPEGWVVKQSSTYQDRIYFFNTRTGATTWTPPGLVESSDTSQKSISETTSETRSRPRQTKKKKPSSIPSSRSSDTKDTSTVTAHSPRDVTLSSTKQQPQKVNLKRHQDSVTESRLQKSGGETLTELSQRKAGQSRASDSKRDERVIIQRCKDARSNYLSKKRQSDERLRLASPSPPWGIPLRGSNLGGTLTPESLTPQSLPSRVGPSDASSVSSRSSKLGSPPITKPLPLQKKRTRWDSSSDSQSKSKFKELKTSISQRMPARTSTTKDPPTSSTSCTTCKDDTRTPTVQPEAASKVYENDLRLRLKRCRQLKVPQQQPKLDKPNLVAPSALTSHHALPLTVNQASKPLDYPTIGLLYLTKMKKKRAKHKKKASKQANESSSETSGLTLPAPSNKTTENASNYGLVNQETPSHGTLHFAEPRVVSSPAPKEDDDISQMEIDVPIEVVDSSKVYNSADMGLRIVLDTNVLMHDLRFVRDLLDKCINGLGRPILVIPWVVMQELDGLKSHSNKGSTAWKAVQFLHECFMADHPRVQGEPLRKVSDEADFEITCNDDWILQCCLQHQKKVGKDLVVLLSNDKHLCSKAVISGIKAFCIGKLLSGLEALADVLRHRPPIPPTSSEPGNHGPKDWSVTLTHRPATPTLIDTPPSSAATEKDVCDELVSEVKEVLRPALAIVLETEMKKAYDDLWTDIVLVKPPWSFQDLMKCYEKHWIAIFGCFLSREDNRRLLQIMELCSAMHRSFTSVKTLINSSVFFCRKLRQHCLYDKALDSPMLKLGELKKRCHLPQTEKKTILDRITPREELTPPASDGIVDTQGIPAIFQAIWLKILQLSALIFEGLGKPHELTTDKTDLIPSELECQACLGVLSPLLRELIEALERVTEIPDHCVMGKPLPFERLFKVIHVFLNEFLSGGQDGFTNLSPVALQRFIMVFSNRQLLKNGITQLNGVFSKLAQCQGMLS